MIDLGKMKYFFNIEVIQSKVEIFICQRRYAREILVEFNMIESNSVRNPILARTTLCKDMEGALMFFTKFKQVIDSRMYPTVTRPYLMYVVSLIRRYKTNLKESHWTAVKQVLRYLNDTIKYEIFYQQDGRTDLMANNDNNYVGDLNDRRSSFASVF